jgi:hypothetical protein
MFDELNFIIICETKNIDRRLAVFALCKHSVISNSTNVKNRTKKGGLRARSILKMR